MDRRALLGVFLFAPMTVHAVDGPIAAASALNGQHPAEYYKRAAAYFRDGDKEAAVIIFYLGQLRYRTHLRARPSLKPDGDPALFASLSETVGRPINEWAFGDVPRLLWIIDAVLDYDSQEPDRFTPLTQFKAARDLTRDGMRDFRRQIKIQAEDIKRQRAANGLENRW
jgi:hypothetical protein